jgi:hypothetical protein
MEGLLPIIRRARRPLFPPEDAAPAVPPVVVELPPPAPLVEVIASAPVEVAPAPLNEAKPEKVSRDENPRS